MLIGCEVFTVAGKHSKRGRGGEKRELHMWVYSQRLKIDDSEQVIIFLELEHCNQPHTYNNSNFFEVGVERKKWSW